MVLATIFLTLSLLLIPTYIYNKLKIKPFPLNSPELIKDDSKLPVLGSMNFFNKRWSFFKECIAGSKTGNFSFRLASVRVVGLSGEANRVHFFTSKYSFQAGYAILFGGSPNNTRSVVEENEAKGIAFDDNPAFTKRFVPLMKKENLERGLTQLIQDVKLRLNELGTEGVIDPFKSIISIVFQLTMRTVGCNEIANDRQLLEKLIKLYQSLESTATPATLLFPWFPSESLHSNRGVRSIPNTICFHRTQTGQSKIRRNYVGAKIYFILKNIIDERKKAGRVEEDSLQTLIDKGDSIAEIVEFVIAALFAGLVNTGPISVHLLCYLATSPHWTSLVYEEIKSVAAKYAPFPDGMSLEEQLSFIPLDAWSSELPILDSALKECIRFYTQECALRMNTSGKDVVMDTGEVIGEGVVLTYHFSDAHMNPSIYTNPEEWDPDRFSPDRAEDEKGQRLAFVGWGAGRHPCLGMKFAKMEVGIIISHFLTRFEYNLVDKDLNPVEKMSSFDADARPHQVSFPTNSNVFFKYKLREVV